MAARERIRLTNAIIARLRPRDREYTVWDTRVAGLGVRIRPSGGASFVLLRNVDGRSKRISLGSPITRDIDEVLSECHALMAKSVPDQLTNATHRAPLFRDFVSGPWKEAHFARYKQSTRRGVTYSLVNQLLPAFGSTPLDRINRNQVLQWFDDFSQAAPGGANRVLDVLRQILNFAVICGHVRINAAQGIKKNRRSAFTRFLSRHEIRRLHRVLDELFRKSSGARQQVDIIRLLLFTGCRKGEIVRLRWAEVNGNMLVLADSKTGPRTIPLNDQARSLLERQAHGESEFVFPSPRCVTRPRARDLPLWYEIRREAKIEDVRLHDLRHTVASHAVMNGVSVPVVSRLLGHTNVQTTLRYAHLADKDIEDTAERIGAAMARVMSMAYRRSIDSTRAPKTRRV